MSQLTLPFIENQVSECLKACGELSQDAKEWKLPNVTDYLYDLSGKLIDLSQDFKVFTQVFQSSKGSQTYDELVRETESQKVLLAQTLADSKQRQLEDLFGDIDGIQIADDNTNLICPLLTDIPEHPVVSKRCHHVFEKQLIEEYIRSKGRAKVQCPIVGCSENISISDLYEDESISERCFAARTSKRNNDWDEI
ncbi:hypothetical protein IKO50_05590 [bacterium]|nr:hypothetical protein [bacterium]